MLGPPPPVVTHLIRPGAMTSLLTGFKSGLHLIVSGDPQFVYTAEQTLVLAVKATGIAIVVGIPLGCLLGIGRFPGRAVLLAIGNALTRVPPVVVGVVVLLLITGQTATGNQTPGPPFAIAGPLAGLSLLASNRDIFAQTMLAIPIMIALTATAVQRISPGLLDQAQAYGAPSWKRGLLAVREARTAVLAAVIVAMGVTITAIGALYVVQGDTGRGCDKSTPATYHATQIACTGDSSLALSALSNFQDSAGEITYADADAMIGIFIILAAGLTFLQQNRTSWIAGGQS